MPIQYLHHIIDIKTFDHDDWLNDLSTTVTDAIVAILFYTHGQPCVEDGQSISIHDFFGPCEERLASKIHIHNGDEMTISRYDDTETLRPRDGPASTRRKAKVTFSTTRKVGKITEPTVTATLLSGSSMGCSTPRTAYRADMMPTYFSNETRPTGKTVAAETLRCLQELEKEGFPEKASSEGTTAEEVEFWRKKRVEAEEKKAKEKSKKRKNAKPEEKTAKDKKRKVTRGKRTEERETGDDDSDASNREGSAEVVAKTQLIGDVYLPDTVANDTIVDDSGDYA